MSNDKDGVSVDPDALAADFAAIRPLITALRDHGKVLGGVADAATKEASSFTSDGKPAPVYLNTITALGAWATKVGAAIEAACTSADHGLESAKSIAASQLNADSDAATKIKVL